MFNGSVFLFFEMVAVYLQAKDSHNSDYTEFLLVLPSQDTAKTETIKYNCSTSNGVYPDKPGKVKILSQKCINKLNSNIIYGIPRLS